MIITRIKLKWNGFWRNVLTRRRTRQNTQFIRVNSALERSISLLQRRYGYIRAKGKSELDKHYPRAWLG